MIDQKIQIACFTGWGQKFDSLEKIFQDSNFDPFFVSSVNYSQFNSVQEFFQNIESTNQKPDVVIGWSLGGQLAIRLIAEEIVAPKLLILIAPPFQMIKDSRIQAGMAPQTFTEFFNNFISAPDATLKKFAILTAMNDRNASEMARSLDISCQNFVQFKYWLEELSRFSCFDIDFSKMPRVLFFHGKGDMIVHISQMEYFRQRIKNFRGEALDNCGHAPQINNLEFVRKSILEEMKLLF